MTNSNLVDYVRISPNRNSPRKAPVDTVSIHCMQGQLSVETCGSLFAQPSRQASSNYGIGKDGRRGMYVEEKDRSWCTSNAKNDHRAITVEVASDKTAPYKVTDAAYNSLIVLLVDICKRNGIKKLVWSTNKNTRVNHLNGANMTVHRDYKAKACPGDYLYDRMSDIANKVNAKLSGTVATTQPIQPVQTVQTFIPYTVRITANTLNIRKGPGTKYATTGQLKKGGVYTIVEESMSGTTKWGRLKSGAGWISLGYTKKV